MKHIARIPAALALGAALLTWGVLTPAPCLARATEPSVARAPAPGPAGGKSAAAHVPARPPLHPGKPTTTIVITHPMDYVLRNYVTLVRQHVLRVPNLRIVGIYHEHESENYAAARAYLSAEKIDWIELHPISCQVDASNVYGNNTCRAAIEPIVAQSQGMVFNGGDDIPPYLYGEPTSMMTVVETPQRHIFETAILVQMLGSTRAPDVVPLLAAHRDYPVLGICVGMQTLNIAAGGTLVQDIPSQVYHQTSVEAALSASPASWHRNHTHERGTDPNVAVGVMHPIHLTPIAPPFMLDAAAAGTHEPLVLSIHHQAVDKLGAGYFVYATSEDGKVIEAIGRHDFPNVLGVQFHPERSGMWNGQEHQQLSPTSTEHNFIYSAMTQDPRSRALNFGIWTWLTEHAVRPAGADKRS